MSVWVSGILRVLRSLLRRRYNGPRQVFQLLVLVSALLIFTDWFHGYTGYSVDLAIPILCSVTLVCNFIFAFWRSHFTQNALGACCSTSGWGYRPTCCCCSGWAPAVSMPTFLGDLPDHQRHHLSGTHYFPGARPVQRMEKRLHM